MSYEMTEVPVERSQGSISKLIFEHKGAGVAFVSQPPQEGFEAQVVIDGVTYHIRIMATCKPRKVDGYGYALSEKRKLEEIAQMVLPRIREAVAGVAPLLPEHAGQ